MPERFVFQYLGNALTTMTTDNSCATACRHIVLRSLLTRAKMERAVYLERALNLAYNLFSEERLLPRYRGGGEGTHIFTNGFCPLGRVAPKLTENLI